MKNFKEHEKPITPDHPDWLSKTDEEPFCPSEEDTKQTKMPIGYCCTRELGHTGLHAAHAGEHQFATWEDDDAEE